jgi:catechol 2,3-dioxygenase-like lactoylglutathione lyase family enzyme
MEHIIDRMLEDFENGRLSRRQLVRSLAGAVAAVAGLPAAAGAAPGLQARAAAPAAMGPAPWKTVWLDHISYAVADYKRSVDFYASLMGWQVRSDNGTSQATLAIGDIGSIIIRNARRRPADAGAAPQTGSQRPPITGVVNHISYGIEPWDTEGVRTELERRGLNPRPDMVGEDFKSYHVTDPDGWDLQISNKTKA